MQKVRGQRGCLHLQAGNSIDLTGWVLPTRLEPEAMLTKMSGDHFQGFPHQLCDTERPSAVPPPSRLGIPFLCKKCAAWLTCVHSVATQSMSGAGSQRYLLILCLHMFPFLRLRGCSPSCLKHSSFTDHTFLWRCQKNPRAPLQARGRGSA